MNAELLNPHPHPSPSQHVSLSQRAPLLLKPSVYDSLPYPLSLLFSTETPDTWAAHETLLYSCLRTGDDKSAKQLIERLTTRFGPKNERVTALRGLYEEATAADEKGLNAVLKAYDHGLSEDPTNLSIAKRRIALFKSMGKIDAAIQALTELLDWTPTDAEAWMELADLYLTQGRWAQSVFCLEEVLLLMPNSWMVHAKMGEVLYLQALAGQGQQGQKDGDVLKGLSESMRRFCRSIELCDDYLRGYYGLKVCTKKLLESLPALSSRPKDASSDPVVGDLAAPKLETVQKLEQLATKKLAEIVRRASSKEQGWDGYSEAEVIAARALLDKDQGKIER